MTALEMLEYLETWAEMHTQEVYGSPCEFIQVNSLLSEIRNLAARFDK